jgi:hypothetical protein
MRDPWVELWVSIAATTIGWVLFYSALQWLDARYRRREGLPPRGASLPAARAHRAAAASAPARYADVARDYHARGDEDPSPYHATTEPTAEELRRLERYIRGTRPKVERKRDGIGLSEEAAERLLHSIFGNDIPRW